ncbi:MAG TPA: cell division protein FtsZ [Gammaproteobacteria bacterium]|jgi:cell division protein FtsZ
MFELMDDMGQNAVIKVVGVGGGGGNAIQYMVSQGVEGVDFVAINTDAQVLRKANAKTTLQIGGSFTKGLGAGANPDVGRQAALEDRDRIEEVLKGADMVFITAGMGGGTGTGASPVVAQVAKELDILVVAVVTKPFGFERSKRMQAAEKGIAELSQYVDSLIVIPNDKLATVLGREITLLNAFQSANEVLLGAVQGIADIITRPGLINVDFADVRTVMSEMGMAMMGTGGAVGENRARRAAEAALKSPLLEDVNFAGAKGVLVNITAGMDLTIGELEEVGAAVEAFADESATVVVGTVLDPSMSGEVRVTVVATGLGRATQAVQPPVLKAKTAAPAPQPMQQQQQPEPVQQPMIQVVKATGTDGASPDWKRLERPTFERRQREDGPDVSDQAYLDIPAFLRRQAD